MGTDEFSIVIPVFNRAWSVCRALASAQKFLFEIGGGEIVVVDDGSTDGSAEIVKTFFEAVDNPTIICQLVILQENGGVCAAKNAGARSATKSWVVFLDSDDELVSSAALAVQAALADHQQCALHFFRCVDEQGVNVGGNVRVLEQRFINDFIVVGTAGESLPIVKRQLFLEFCYDEDINGFESLCYIRMVKALGSTLIHPIIARKYYTSHEGRLSSRSGIRLRSLSLARGYARMLREHYSILDSRGFVFIGVRLVYHGLRSILR